MTDQTPVVERESVRVYKVDQGYVVADDGGWIPGCFETVDDALAAAS